MQYLFANHVLDTDRRELRRGARPVAAEPQVFDLLVYLLENRDRVVSKDDLIASVWDGRIVSDSTLSTRINAARRAVGDSGEKQKLIRTIARKGLRFVGVVQMQSQDESAHASPPAALPERPSLAVLPFDNISGAAADTYFADGIAEDITTELSRYPDLFVIARNSSFTYRGKSVRVTDVGRELGVKYVLEGSVRRAGTQVRITAQLVDAGSGNHLWAQRYDRSLEDIFAVQDEVTRSIVAVLPARVEAAASERASRKTSNSLEAYDCLLRGKFCHHLENAEANRAAEAHFDEAIRLDPHFASAWAWKACTLGQAWTVEFRPRTPELYRQINELVEAAYRLDENDTECHRIMCRLALMQGHFAKSEHHLDRALALNPNDPRLVVQRGVNLTHLGNPDAAISWIERAMRIDPFSASRYHLDLVRALFMAGRRPTEAIAVLERTTREHHEHYLWLAACHAAAGSDASAQEAARKAVALRSDLSIAAILRREPPWKRAEDKTRLVEALLRAGLPD